MTIRTLVGAALLTASARANASAPPLISHQPISCTMASRPISVCAIVTGKKGIAHARVYFRRSGEKSYSYVEMSFSDRGYCATLPAPLAGKTPKIEYYLQGIDNEGTSRQSPAYPVDVKGKDDCTSRPLQDPAYHGEIKVFATHVDQGRHLPKGFDPTGVTFVPAPSADKKLVG